MRCGGSRRRRGLQSRRRDGAECFPLAGLPHLHCSQQPATVALTSCSQTSRMPHSSGPTPHRRAAVVLALQLRHGVVNGRLEVRVLSIHQQPHIGLDRGKPEGRAGSSRDAGNPAGRACWGRHGARWANNRVFSRTCSGSGRGGEQLHRGRQQGWSLTSAAAWASRSTRAIMLRSSFSSWSFSAASAGDAQHWPAA